MNNVVGLIFSKDRAMQLQATIESFLLHCQDMGTIDLVVLYKTSNGLHAQQYEELKRRFSNINFVEESNFRTQVLTILGKFNYVLFLVDDNLFVKDFHLIDITSSLQENTDAAGFSLRLGKNTNYCYTKDSTQTLPLFQQSRTGILTYNWTQAEFDFGYPLELSSSIYRTRDILILLDELEFNNPNILEGQMAANARFFAGQKSTLLCCENSLTFCNPINKVQSVWNNRCCSDNKYSADALAELFHKGVRIDVESYSNFIPNACHQEVQLYFKQAADLPHKKLISTAESITQYDNQPNANAKPQFSVVMANYNRAGHIGQAIKSVIHQTFKNWELIIVDDCSTDNSLDIITQCLNDKRIKLIQLKSNCGYATSMKTGITNVRSDYFGILHSDDCLLPQAIETMYEHHIKFPDCGLIYSQFAYCDENLNQKHTGFCREIPRGRSSLDVRVSHFITFKLCDYLKTTGYDENILYAEDIDIIYKMEEVTRLKFVDKCVYLYRELPNSISHSKSKINVRIMSGVKARINALKRRCTALAASRGQTFEQMLRQVLRAARANHREVEQYFIILRKLYENGVFKDIELPPHIESRDIDDKLPWIAANVNIKLDKLFELLADQRKNEGQPLVSIYMVTYNAQEFIAQAIESVLAQTYKNFELLIVNDGSNDETGKIVASYSDERIRYIYKKHKNFASGMNRAIIEAKGEYIIGVDSDDFVGPDYIEKLVTCAEKHPEVDYFYPAKFVLVDESGNRTGAEWNYLDFSDNRILPAFLFDQGYGPIPNPGSLKRRSLFTKKCELYKELETVEDFTFLCRNALRINFMRVRDHSTYFYRRMASGNSQKLKARNQLMARALNDMVLIYPPQVLYPQIRYISPGLREKEYYKYLMTTFYKHSHGNMVRYGKYFQQYGDYYKAKLLSVEGGNKVVGSASALSDQKYFVELFKQECNKLAGKRQRV